MTTEERQELVVEAPEDVTITKLELRHGRVSEGQPLATLSSLRLKWLESKLNASVAESNIRQRAITEGRIDRVIEALDEKVKFTKAAFEDLDEILKINELQIRVGSLSSNDLMPLRRQVAEARVRLCETERDQISSEGKFRDFKARIEISRARLQKEMEILGALMSRLQPKAPSEGFFVASVGQDGFVLAGDPIGVIYRGEREVPQYELVCSAPEDIIVEALTTSRGNVKRGQPIATLSCAMLTHFRSKLDSLKANLVIQRQPFTDGRIEKLEAKLKLQVLSARAALEASQTLTKNKREDYKRIGAAILVEVLLASANEEDAHTQWISATLHEQQFPNKIKDMEDRIKITESRLKVEEEIFETLRARMRLSAPEDGEFVASAGIGSFVQKGDPIGTLYL